MRVLLLADLLSTHTQKWLEGLVAADIEVGCFSLMGVAPSGLSKVLIYHARTHRSEPEGLGMAELPGIVAHLRKAIRDFQPDIIHAHYASKAGILGALSGFHPFLLSVWGSDVFEFPRRSALHRAVLKFNLARADGILATSHTLAAETSRYTRKAITVIPFGVDTRLFRPTGRAGRPWGSGPILGSVKQLTPVYGLTTVLQATAMIKDSKRHPNLKLILAGNGPQENELKSLTKSLGLEGDVIFTGWYPHSEVAKLHNEFDVEVYLSLRESFGVVVLEAGACGKPVVVSSASGFREIVEDGLTGIIVPPEDARAAADAIMRVLSNPQLAQKMGDAARRKVQSEYEWTDCVARMVDVYRSQLPARAGGHHSRPTRAGR